MIRDKNSQLLKPHKLHTFMNRVSAIFKTFILPTKNLPPARLELATSGLPMFIS